jgi:origin recognition complex subunit 4
MTHQSIDFTDDFKDEFGSIKQLPADEVEKDQLVLRIKRNKLLDKLEEMDKFDEMTTSGAVDQAGKSRRAAANISNGKANSDERSSNKYNLLTPSEPPKKKKKIEDYKTTSRKFDKIRGIPLIRKAKSFVPGNAVSDKSDELIQISSEDNTQEGDVLMPINIDDDPQPTVNVEENPQIKNSTPILTKDLIISDIVLDGVPSQTIPEPKPIQVEVPSNLPILGSTKSPRSDPLPTIDSELITTISTNDSPNTSPINDFSAIKRQVLAQLTGRFSNCLSSPTLFEKYTEVHKMFEHTIRDNESHSTLIIGPRASGKSTIVERALQDMEEKYEGQFITVRLNAFLHSDDNVALREIAKQLDFKGMDENEEEDVSEDEPKDQLSKNNFQDGKFQQRSINDTFSNILSILDSKIADEASKMSIIFVIDEFEKFTSSSKQTLLYNLFDLCQNSSTPICVVGVSTKITTRELLEKRVRSRFSQRIITINKPTTIEEFWTNARLALVVQNETINNISQTDNSKSIQSIDESSIILWNNYIDLLFSEKSNLKKLVFQNFYTTKNYKEFNNSCIYPISKITSQDPFPQDIHFTKYLSNQASNNIQSIIQSLSSLELLLAIAAARWIEKFDLQVINFNLAYIEYKDMMKNSNMTTTTSSSSSLDNKLLTNFRVNQKIWSSKVLKNSWEILYKVGLLLDASGLSTNNEGHIITNVNLNKNLIIEDNKMVQLDVSLEELSWVIGEGSGIKGLTKL